MIDLIWFKLWHVHALASTNWHILPLLNILLLIWSQISRTEPGQEFTVQILFMFYLSLEEIIFAYCVISITYNLVEFAI